MNKTISRVNSKVSLKVKQINKQINKQQVITVAVLILLVVAVQVSTNRAGDWMFLGFNLIEFGTDAQPGVSTISDARLSASRHIGELIGGALECIMSSISQ